MMAVKVEVIGTKWLSKKFDSLNRDVQSSVMEAALQAGSLVILKKARENIKENGLIKTRTLSRSLSAQVKKDPSKNIEVEIGTNIEYAPVHEYGGIIRPRNGKYLAIPVGNYKDSPRNHKNLLLRKTATGKLLLVGKRGKVHYVLLTSVQIPAKPFLRPAFDSEKDEALAKAERVIRKFIKSMTEKNV